LSAVGRRADALRSVQEAVGLYRMLARQNPNAFNPDLGLALASFGQLLVGMEQPAEGVGVLAEAVRALQPQFVQLPEAYERLMRPLANLYQKAAEAASMPPDLALLEPILKSLQDLQGRDPRTR